MFTTIIAPFGKPCQIKTGWDNCDTYKIGDKIPWTPDPLYPGEHIDGIYLGFEKTDNDTVVVIKDCTVTAIFPRRWDRPTDIQIAMLKKEYGITPPDRSLWSEEAWAKKEAHDKEIKERREEWDRKYAHYTPREKMAAAMGEYVKQKMSEPSMARRILPPKEEGKKYIRLKIIGDGTSANTHLIDEETGREIEMGQEIGIVANVDRPLVECYLHLLNVKLDLVAHANLEHLKKGADKFETHYVCALCEKACPEGEDYSKWLVLGISNSLPTDLTDEPKVDFYKSICPTCSMRIRNNA